MPEPSSTHSTQLGQAEPVDFLTDPWGWWIAPFLDSELMRDALLAGFLTVVTTSLVGTWVVLRGMSFFGDAFDGRVPVVTGFATPTR